MHMQSTQSLLNSCISYQVHVPQKYTKCTCRHFNEVMLSVQIKTPHKEKSIQPGQQWQWCTSPQKETNSSSIQHYISWTITYYLRRLLKDSILIFWLHSDFLNPKWQMYGIYGNECLCLSLFPGILCHPNILCISNIMLKTSHQLVSQWQIWMM
jgi:hypothetical protein